MRCVYNIEPKDYSKKAISIWEESGYQYVEGSWNEYVSFKAKEEVTVLIVRLGGMVTSEVLDAFPNLKFVISATTGHNHLDKAAIAKRDIKLISLRGHEDFLKTIPSTAEFTWALLLNLLRKIPSAISHVEDGNWDRELFKGYQLYGKKIGLVGLGRIGSIVARYAEAFGMIVEYVDPNVENTRYIRKMTLEDLVEDVDILSIHVHSDASNYNLIDAEIISKLKEGAYLLNTSRGEIWDEQAVVDSVLSGKLSGVGTDVVVNETTGREQSPIWKARNHSNILLTPHIGGASYDAMWQCEIFLQKILIGIVKDGH